ncbi:MAG: hypothetical protein KJ989_12935 [Gammaproteobacteria bacterium]|uniref:Uncharacterized protein n=1 Tax=viral metagenome TaxID=1070528 RepID=A0A6H1ZVK8_9ZZZZ|nr:hypothetical protein [Gammaproteobacteria bacterium]MBU2157120.1 hypothetical protein [Gammaproteobacteria bacterium]MBU2256034.1 hypothetical protein [Gammaproteobacteria bacterium]MBU2295102.1 hypothetical protein [Gammaproteobacteria bacterium]
MIDEFSLNFGKVGIWGWPWHGLISKEDDFSPSEIQLPNGTTRLHDMPEAPWYTYRLKVPGVAAIDRTPEQVAADLALGMEWRNEAILCGRFFQVYGRDLGGWIYCAADGSRWTINWQAETASRMGLIGKPADVRSLTVNMAVDNGQSTPVVDLGSGAVLVIIDPMPMDITPDGRKAILMQYCNDPAYSPGERKIPLGFLLAEVVGDIGTAFELNVTVLHDRTETLGTTDYEDAMTITLDGGGNPNSATGYETRDIEGRIWAAWFDAGGGTQTCTIDQHEELAQECPLSAATGYHRQLVRRRLRVNGVQKAEAELESEFDSMQTGTVDGTGTLNGETIYDETIPGYLYALPKSGAYSLLHQVMPRNYMPGVNVGDRCEVLPFSNNLLAFYISLTGTGSTDPEHRYLGAATPMGSVTINATEEAEIVSSPQREALYGPASYGAFNPVTYEFAAPSAAPIGWT